MSYVAFLVYVGVITTYQLRVGDIAIGAALIALPFERRGFRFPAWFGLMTLLVIWAGIGYLRSPYQAAVGEELINLGKLWLIVLVAVNVLNTRSRIRLFLIFWLTCFALYPARGTLVNYFVGGYTVFGRALWNYIYANPNDLATLTLLQLSLAAGVLASDAHKWMRRGALAALFVLPLIIVLTQSRGGFIGLVMFAALALTLQRRLVRGLALVGIVGTILLMLIPSRGVERLSSVRGMFGGEESIAAMDEEGSARQRWEIWQTAAMIIRDHPVTGVGWGAYKQADREYAAWTSRGRGGKDSHSTYLNVLAETGWPGLILFLGMIALVWLEGQRVARRSKQRASARATQLRYLLLGLLAFLLAGIFGSYGKLSFLYLHLTCVWAATDVLRRETLGRTTGLRSLPLEVH